MLERGTAVGRFVVLGLLGRGGMGEVYAAHDPELDRKVAIKLLRGGAESESPQGRQRLVREAQAIARVSHPSVVVVYDVGTFGGRVFIAMELVDGSTLRYWAHAARRSWPEVLEVFIAAGKGLGAAHDRGLVHRDFKPDNVMITADGKIRVMDFGLVQMRGDRPPTTRERQAPLAPPSLPPARPRRRADTGQLDEEDITTTRRVITAAPTPGRPARDRVEESDVNTTRPVGDTTPRAPASLAAGLSVELTGAGVSLGTPAYMSPEQFLNERTDARTDQFSFCVSLYETLYGERPFGGRNYDELSAAVQEGEVRDPPATPEGREVPGWLRQVLLRGLKPDPRDRWPSMSALLAQLEDHPAVESRARFQAAAEAKLAGVWDAARGVHLETAEQIEMREAFLATGKTYAAKAYAGTCEILDRYARRWIDLYVESCEATHVRAEQSAEVLDLRMACLFEGLADLAALVRMFRRATAEVVEKAVSAATALDGLERCENIELLRSMVRPPADTATRARVERVRAQLAEVRALCRVGRMTEGLAAIAPLEQEARALGYEPLLADVLLVYGRCFEEQGQMDDAARLSSAAALTAIACRHDETAAEAATLAGGHTSMHPEVSETWNQVAEALLRRIGGHELLRAWVHNNRAVSLVNQGRLEEGFHHALASLTLKEKVLEPGHPDIAIALGNIGVYLDEAGRLDEGIEHCRRAVEIGEAGFGSDHPRTALFLTNYSELLARKGQWLEAKETATRALAIFERETDRGGTLVFVALIALGTAQLGSGAIDAALTALERADQIGDAAAPTPAYRAQAQFALARALWAQGRDRARALSLATVARENYERAPQTPATRRELALIAAWRETRDSPR